MGTRSRKTLFGVVVLLAVVAGLRLLPWGSRVLTARGPDRTTGPSVATTDREPTSAAPPKFLPAKRPFPGMTEQFKREGAAVHDREPRDETWAPAMEAAFGKRYTPNELAKYGLSDLRITELSCRRVTCRLAYEYPSSVEDLLVADGLPRYISPLVLIEEQTGPPAPMNLGWTRDAFDRGGQRFVKMEAVFGFDEDSYDPERFDEWRESQLPRTREWFERVERTWPDGEPQRLSSREKPHEG